MTGVTSPLSLACLGAVNDRCEALRTKGEASQVRRCELRDAGVNGGIAGSRDGTEWPGSNAAADAVTREAPGGWGAAHRMGSSTIGRHED